MVLRVEGDGLREEVNRLVVVFGREGLVALVFQGVRLVQNGHISFDGDAGRVEGDTRRTWYQTFE